MKIVAVCLIALSATACATQTTHVSTAYSLYSGCINASIPGAFVGRTAVNNPKEVNDFAEEVDDRCLGWMVVWFPSFAEGRHIIELTAAEVDSFNRQRYNLLRSMINGINAAIKKNPAQ